MLNSFTTCPSAPYALSITTLSLFLSSLCSTIHIYPIYPSLLQSLIFLPIPPPTPYLSLSFCLPSSLDLFPTSRWSNPTSPSLHLSLSFMPYLSLFQCHSCPPHILLSLTLSNTNSILLDTLSLPVHSISPPLSHPHPLSNCPLSFSLPLNISNILQ